MTTAGRAGRRPGEDGDRELTVDELAARVGVTVRNVRAYSARGLLPPPAHGRPHRLLRPRARRPAAAGPRDARRGLLAGDDRAHARLGAADRQLGHPRPAPRAAGARGCRRSRRSITGAELAARAGVPEDPALVDRLVDLGLVERVDEGELRVLDPALLTAGLQVVALGVPPDDLIDAQTRVNEHVREIAADLRADVPAAAACRRSSTPARRRTSCERVQDTVARLQPAAAQALLAAFRTEMAAAVEEAIESVLSRLAEE